LPSEDKQLSNEDLIESLNGLSDGEVTLIEMKYFEKRSHKEIGEILGITVANAKVKLHRVIKKMRERLEVK
jgi:RNA polymerase sigma-70 factor (ECF subfamily)